MGIFNKLFGGKKQNNNSSQLELRLEYNIMTKVCLETSEKYENKNRFEMIEKGIYKDLKEEDDAKYRMTISYQLDSEDTQYPLEDVLDKYCLHVSDFYESENSRESNKIIQELGGTLDSIQEVQNILGKKIFNRDFIDEEGQQRVDLIIE